MWIKKEEGWIEEEKGIMDIERGFPLFKMLRLWMYSLESSKSQCVFLLCFLLLLLAQGSLKSTRPHAKGAPSGLSGVIMH